MQARNKEQYHDMKNDMVRCPANKSLFLKVGWAAIISSMGVMMSAVNDKWSLLRPNLRIWRALNSSGFILFCFFVSVSELEENTRSHGTADAWIGR